MIWEFGVSDVLIYGFGVKFNLWVFLVMRLVVIMMFGFEVLVYEVIVVIVMVLLCSLKE